MTTIEQTKGGGKRGIKRRERVRHIEKERVRVLERAWKRKTERKREEERERAGERTKKINVV